MSWESAIRAVLRQVSLDRDISKDALARINEHLESLTKAVIDEARRRSVAKPVRVAIVEEVIKHGLQGELAKSALDKVKEARESSEKNSGLSFAIGNVRKLLISRNVQSVEKGVSASLAALLQCVCGNVLELSEVRCEAEIKLSDVEAVVRGDQELNLLFHPNDSGRHMTKVQLDSGECVVDAREAEASTRKAVDGGMNVSRKDVEFAGAWLRRIGFETVAERANLLPHGGVLLSNGEDSNDADNGNGTKAIQRLFETLEGESPHLAENVKHARQLRLIGPTNNGKSHLARCVAQLWVASGADANSGRWIEAKPIKMTTMEEHLWSAREDSGDGVRREVWGPLRYLWEFAKLNPHARFALILNESNRGGLFNILNAVWWEPRRAIGVELDSARDPPANLAIIFTENPATADYSVVGGDDEALSTRLGAAATWAVVHGGNTDNGELKRLCGVPPKMIDMSHVGLNFADNCHKDLEKLPPGLELLPAGEQLCKVLRLPRVGEADGGGYAV